MTAPTDYVRAWCDGFQGRRRVEPGESPDYDRAWRLGRCRRLGLQPDRDGPASEEAEPARLHQ